MTTSTRAMVERRGLLLVLVVVVVLGLLDGAKKLRTIGRGSGNLDEGSYLLKRSIKRSTSLRHARAFACRAKDDRWKPIL
jgi:hypothetical protein